MPIRLTRFRSRLVLIIGLAFFSLVVLGPMYWIFTTSFKTEAEVYANPPSLWPHTPTLMNYGDVMTKTSIPHYFWNSVVVSLLVTLIALVISCVSAYSISRLHFRGRWMIAKAMLVIYLIPSSLMFIPMYIFVRQLHLDNTLSSLILVYPVFVMPYMTWLLISYFSTIPVEIEESAMVDGCSRLSVLHRVVMPMALPGILTVTIYAFTQSWNELLYAATFISSERYRTLPYGLSEMMLSDQYKWGRIMAASALMSLPVILLYMAMQRYVIQGYTAGGVKG